jgi:uncharacterized protein
MNRSAWPTSTSTAWTSPISNETFFDDALVLPTYNKRWTGIGKNIRGVIVVVFVTLGKEAVSVISMRPANKNERKLYANR